MACNSIRLSSSSLDTANKDVHSAIYLYNGRKIRRLCSDHHLYYSHASLTEPGLKNSRSLGKFPFNFSSSMLPNSVKSFLFDPDTSKDMNVAETVEGEMENVEKKRANWVGRLLEIRNHWKIRKQLDDHDGDEGFDEGGEDGGAEGEGDEGCCEVDYNDEGGMTYNRESFSRLLSEVKWSDTKITSQLAFLCNMAYAIPELKGKDLRKHYRLRLITSSLEKNAEAAALKAQLEVDSESGSDQKVMEREKKHVVRPSVAYEITALAATYAQSEPEQMRRENGLGLRDDKESASPALVYKSEVAAYVAASTMTAVVAAGEKQKLKAAKDFRSLHSSPCEWFICDDYSTSTRCFVIQGSDSVASWHANLFFELTKFEGTDVLVHRGIYEAAKGIYEQFLPHIMEHLNTFGDRAKLQFTGHSLGGSLSLLVNLMLLSRKVIKPSVLRPVVTFGSPFVFCGGQKILEDLGLDQNHVRCVIMHRDVVPRAFSCNYPNFVVQLLKRLHGTFRSHPCLNKNKLVYSPMGKIYILQPDERSSPPHPLLPPGSALYSLENAQCGSYTNAALRAFLNSPHPLETLSDPTAYGSEGTILRDRDSSNYLKALNGVLRQQKKMVVRNVKKERNLIWPILNTSLSSQTWDS